MLADEPTKPVHASPADADGLGPVLHRQESDTRSSALWGVPCVIGAAFSFSVHGASVKIATSSGFSLLQLSLLIGTIRLVCALVILPFQRRWWRNILCTGQSSSFVALVVFRNVIGCAALFLIYNALSRLPLGEGTSLVFTAPIWVTVLAYVCLGEPITRYNVLAALLAVGGVSLIASGQNGADAATAAEVASDLIGLGETGVPLDESPAHSERQLGIACALLGAVALSLVMVTTRKVRTHARAAASARGCACERVSGMLRGERVCGMLHGELGRGPPRPELCVRRMPARDCDGATRAH
jgi:drug/metabolite transporter (DMT)-like permease